MQKNKKILLVDDEEVIRLSFKRELQEFYDVTLASNYKEALAFLSEKQFDLLITDLVMPGLNGLELLKNVKIHSPEMYVIIITAYGEIGAVIEALRAGADDFLLKPCDVEELLLRIGKTFERQDFFKKVKIYEKIFRASEDLIALVDENGTYLVANRAYLDAYGKSGEELVGNSMADIVGRELYSTKIRPWLDHCFSGTAVQHLDLFKLAGRGVRSMVVSCYPVIKEDATAVTSVAMVIKDVTDILHDSIDLQQREERLRMAHSLSANGFMDCDLTSGNIFYCDNWNKLLGYAPGTLQESGKNPLELLHPDDKISALNAIQDCVDGIKDNYDHELRLQKADGSWMWFHSRGMVVERDANGVPMRVVGLLSDIAGPKALQQNFMRDKQLLEQNVFKKTKELARHNEELTEANAALTVLLKKRQQDKEEVEQRLSENVLNLIEPLVKRLHRTPLNAGQAHILAEIEDNLHDITSSFVTKLTSQYAGLTPMEIQVATHVKQGKPTKEIADILCLAPDTVNVHRKKIRKKLGLRNKSVNLQTFLSSLAEE
jgi:PAS domain S-box-containing protein